MVIMENGKRRFEPPFLEIDECLGWPDDERMAYLEQVVEWVRANGVDPDDHAALQVFCRSFMKDDPVDGSVHDAEDGGGPWDPSMFKPPFKWDLDYYRLPPAGRKAYDEAVRRWLVESQPDADSRPVKDFSVITPENIDDMFDDDADEITPEERAALKAAVLAGKVPGYVDEDGSMHLGTEESAKRRCRDGR